VILYFFINFWKTVPKFIATVDSNTYNHKHSGECMHYVACPIPLILHVSNVNARQTVKRNAYSLHSVEIRTHMRVHYDADLCYCRRGPSTPCILRSFQTTGTAASRRPHAAACSASRQRASDLLQPHIIHTLRVGLLAI